MNLSSNTLILSIQLCFLLCFIGVVMVNGLEWNGQIKIENSVTIPVGENLVIKEGAVVSFAPTTSASGQILIRVEGRLNIESGVELKSDDILNNQNGTNDQWGFLFPIGTQQGSLTLTNSKIRKSSPLSSGVATFSFEGGDNSTGIVLDNCEVDGGFIGIHVSSNIVISIKSSSFSNMISAVQTDKTSFPKMTFFDSKFTGMGIAIDDRGISSNGDLVYRTISLTDCKFKSVSRAISASCKVVVSSNVFQAFRGAITAPFVHCTNSIFDNRQYIVSALGLYISNIPQGYKGEVFIKDSTFSEITGSVFGSQGDVVDFTFVNNIVRNCATSAGLKTRHSLIEMAAITGSVSITKNDFVGNQIVAGSSAILSLHQLQSLAYITHNNFHDNNINTCTVKMSNVPDALGVLTFSQNTFTNYFGSKSEIATEFCYEGPLGKKINIAYNYWGTDPTSMDATQMYDMIISKLKPLDALEFTPYYLTSNVDDQSSTNLGGLHKPIKPNSSIIATVIGGLFGGITLVLFISMIIAVTVILIRRRRKGYESLI
ncbi:hypothetical protein NAEGRDRAFT_68493 [Naegleria gruberi]|uniref:Right handed beta helix domain-containing protein n=1 Tax=Naegleria gruberi TaxID=5762 RepID=D2VHY9_NAEGR|nr:uncharacterized protein NAEGRDRAFT_68493 [Naegleria gruberi]EFC43421.1 hypothetical protein NAEGRDRAFT_68493 [Naegleria gruberi]|eukprot:XP_002676165.1 hypothetical protein NAEGRDRAFT_68493 [Naegleria gruberi strain NEG-M]